MPEERKWKLLTVAPDQLTAELWCELLLREDIPAVVNPGDTASFMGVSPLPCRLMVAEEYLERARQLLVGLGPEEPGTAAE
ncbi:MAG: DUF2007 domain-containing protein [Dehalococcoidales bacterium]